MKCGCTVLCGVLWVGAAAAAGAEGPVDAARAGSIALEHTGGGQVMEVDRHYGGDGLTYFRVEVVAPDGRYHVEIDSATGRLLQLVRKGGGRVLQAAPAGTGGGMSYEEALQLAMAQTGGGQVMESDVDRKRSGRIVYEFEIINNGVKYEIEIDGATGSILDFEQKRAKGWARHMPMPATPAPAAAAAPSPAPVAVTPTAQTAPGQPRLNAAAAQALARERAGGGTVTKYEADWDDGRLYHEITVVNQGTRYKMEIDDASGDVVEYSLKR